MVWLVIVFVLVFEKCEEVFVVFYGLRFMVGFCEMSVFVGWGFNIGWFVYEVLVVLDFKVLIGLGLWGYWSIFVVVMGIWI